MKVCLESLTLAFLIALGYVLSQFSRIHSTAQQQLDLSDIFFSIWYRFTPLYIATPLPTDKAIAAIGRPAGPANATAVTATPKDIPSAHPG